MINYYNSLWGIKRSNECIKHDIISILYNANNYIIIGGYNFTFKTDSTSFFGTLLRKIKEGCQVLMIMPPNLYSFKNTHLDMIRFCLNNNIALILNGNNHSKWILTDCDIYYGSSNFSETSWTTKVEVISIHNLSLKDKQWKIDTENDFRTFVTEEISKIHNRDKMKERKGLIQHTKQSWNKIEKLMLKLNPSIEKVIQTLSNYESSRLTLEDISSKWFHNSPLDSFMEIHKANYSILSDIDNLCEYAYANIHNESMILEGIDSTKNISIDDTRVKMYNNYHKTLVNGIENRINQFDRLVLDQNDDFVSKNDNLLGNILSALNQN